MYIIKHLLIIILNISLVSECYVTMPLHNIKKLKLLNNRFENINNSSEYLFELLALIDVAMKIK
jgi:hypothetical protein